MSGDVLILGIETSCDETAAAVVKNGRTVLANIISSQIDVHSVYGGVVPEIASRKHIEGISQVVAEAMREAGIGFMELSAIGVTYGPGLVGALLVGLSYAKALAFGIQRPLVGVNHIEAHIAANYIENDCKPPFMCLVVSGGHTHLLIVRDYASYEVLGRTQDDAAGEAFDKIARAAGLGYPGGPQIDRLAKEGNPYAYRFPRASLENIYDFSFSGLKSAVLNHINQCKLRKEELCIPDLAASFQQAVVDVLVDKTMRACIANGLTHVALAGGVSANGGLRAAMTQACEKHRFTLSIPPVVYCTDNAAMVAAQAYERFRRGQFDGLDLNAIPGLPLASCR